MADALIPATLMGKTTLAAAVGSVTDQFFNLTTTSITVGPYTAVTASAPQWSVAIDGEIADVELVSGNLVKVVRGVHGTQAKVHAKGAVVWAAPTNNFLGAVPFGTFQQSTRLRYTTVAVGSVAYASFGNDTTLVAGTLYLADIFVTEGGFVATGIGVLNGGTVTTDLHLVTLLDTAMNVLASSSLAGSTPAGTNAFQDRAFSPGPIYLPQGHYFVGLQSNGTHATLSTIAASTFVSTLTTSKTGTFGTIPTGISVPTTFTANVGPIAYLY